METRTERVYHDVNGNPGVSTLGGRQQHVAEARDHLAKKFGVPIGGYRPGDTDGMGTGHGDGLALDLMVGDNKALGDEISQYVLENYQNLNVSYVIWQQRFWAPFNSFYSGPGQWGSHA